ncbi:MAG: hypothetical protein NVS1B2_10800 [Vulcanimicrobiaceae bacterium]
MRFTFLPNFLIAALAIPMVSACSGGGTSLSPIAATTPKASVTPAAGAALPVASANVNVIASPSIRPELAPITERTAANKAGAVLKRAIDGASLFSDNFANGKADAWTTLNNGWSTCSPSERTAFCASDPWDNAAFAGSSAWTDYTAQATMAITNIENRRNGVDLLARVQDAHHFYELELLRENDGSQQWELWRNDGDNWTNLARGFFPFNLNEAFAVRLSVRGSQLVASVSRDGARTFDTLGSADDTRYASGGTGLRAWGGANGWFTDVSVTETKSYVAAASTSERFAAAGSQPFGFGPFNETVNSPQYDANSDRYVSNVMANDYYHFGKMQFGINESGETDGNTTIYIAHNSDPVYTIHCRYYSGCPIEGVQEHIPVGAVPSARLGNSYFLDDNSHDQHMAVRNVDSQVEIDTWLTVQPNGRGGTLEVGYGGQYPFSSGGFNQPGGATAAGFALSQGRVRAVDLLAGHIPYGLVLITPCENGHVYPATGDDHGNNYNCPPLGAHLWLDSTPQEVAASGAATDFKVILNALHEYGGYLADRCTACTLGVALEGGAAYTAMGEANPWKQIAAHFPDEQPSGNAGEYHILISSGNIDLRRHLHFITR